MHPLITHLSIQKLLNPPTVKTVKPGGFGFVFKNPPKTPVTPKTGK